MGKKRTDVLRGTLDLLILKALALEPLHGVAVSRRITQITGGAFQVSFGSLFPSLHCMEEKGWVEAEWLASENNRRAKYYRLTSSGKAQLRAEERDWGSGGQDHDGGDRIRPSSHRRRHARPNCQFLPKRSYTAPVPI